MKVYSMCVKSLTNAALNWQRIYLRDRPRPVYAIVHADIGHRCTVFDEREDLQLTGS